MNIKPTAEFILFSQSTAFHLSKTLTQDKHGPIRQSSRLPFNKSQSFVPVSRDRAALIRLLWHRLFETPNILNCSRAFTTLKPLLVSLVLSYCICAIKLINFRAIVLINVRSLLEITVLGLSTELRNQEVYKLVFQATTKPALNRKIII